MVSKTALIIVDVQSDFLPPDGALAVPGGREVIPLIKDLLSDAWDWQAIIATQVSCPSLLQGGAMLNGQDYHPKGHISFASSHEGQKPLDVLDVKDGWGRDKSLALWPDHCVVGTRGSELDSDLSSSFAPVEGKLKLARKVCRQGEDKINYDS